MTRKFVKDGILYGQNRGEVEDKRAEKFDELAVMQRDNGSGIRSQVDGFAQVEWQCIVCGHKHSAPKEHAGGITVTRCPICMVMREHERAR